MFDRDTFSEMIRASSVNFRYYMKFSRRLHIACAVRKSFAQPSFVGSRRRIHHLDADSCAGIAYHAYNAGVHVLVGIAAKETRAERSRRMYVNLTDSVSNLKKSNPSKMYRQMLCDTTKGESMEADLLTDKMANFYASSTSMVAGFSVGDITSTPTQENVLTLGPFDVITYFGDTLACAGLDYAGWERQFAFWGRVLTDTGTVILETIDPRVMELRVVSKWTNVSKMGGFTQKQIENYVSGCPLNIGNSLYMMEWPANQPVYPLCAGDAYRFKMLAQQVRTYHYISNDDMMSLANRHGLAYSCQNVLDAQRPETKDLFEQTPDEKALIGLFQTITLRRIAMPIMTKST